MLWEALHIWETDEKSKRVLKHVIFIISATFWTVLTRVHCDHCERGFQGNLQLLPCK